jgi:hypothetical protein
LAAARRQSKQSVCLARIKNIATSSKAYEADDPQGWGIPVHPRFFTQEPDNPTYIGAYEWGGKSGIGKPGFTEGPAHGAYAWVSSKYGTRAGFGPATRPLNDILYPGGLKDNLVPSYDRTGAKLDTQLKLDLYRCPGDDGPARGAHCPDWLAHSERSSYDHFGTSYAANIFMIALQEGCEPGLVRSNSPYLRPITRVPNPSRTLMYEENIGRWAWACRREPEPCCLSGIGVDPGPTKAVRGWHGKDWTFNRAFVDSHAETQKIIIEGTEDEEGYSLHYRFEEVYSDSELQEYWHCIVVRGNGWQKDTLPANLIPAGLGYDWDRRRPSYEDCVESVE